MKGKELVRNAAVGIVAVSIVYAILAGGPAGGPELVPLTAARLRMAEATWSSVPRTYRAVLRFEVAKVDPVTYEVGVVEGTVVRLLRNGVGVSEGGRESYSMEGLFQLLESELQLVAPDATGLPPVKAELFARFDPATGRLEQYRRSTARRATGLRVQVLEYREGESEPASADRAPSGEAEPSALASAPR